jgi:hypothetical protein
VAGRHAEASLTIHRSKLIATRIPDSLSKFKFTIKENLMPPILGEPTRVSLAPHGLDQIRATFGDIFQYILSDHTLDPRWQSESLTRIQLPRLSAPSLATFNARACSPNSPASVAASHFVRSALARNFQLTPGVSRLI